MARAQLPELTRSNPIHRHSSAPGIVAGVDLEWQTMLRRKFEPPVPAPVAEAQARLCLGDWCWDRGLELAAEHRLPFKIHTGHYAGGGRMPVDWIRAGELWELSSCHRLTRGVLGTT